MPHPGIIVMVRVKALEGREAEVRRLVVGGDRVAMRTTRAAGLGAGAEGFLDDRLDGARATSAFGAATKATIDLLGVAHGVVGISDGGADVVIAQDVTGTDDHG